MLQAGGQLQSMAKFHKKHLIRRSNSSHAAHMYFTNENFVELQMNLLISLGPTVSKSTK